MQIVRGGDHEVAAIDRRGMNTLLLLFSRAFPRHHELMVAASAIHPSRIPTWLECGEQGVSQGRRVV